MEKKNNELDETSEKIETEEAICKKRKDWKLFELNKSINKSKSNKWKSN